jgi:hypothetical protein
MTSFSISYEMMKHHLLVWMNDDDDGNVDEDYYLYPLLIEEAYCCYLNND